MMMQYIKKFAKYSLIYTNCFKLISDIKFKPSTSLRILSFHKIYKEWDNFFPGITEDQFEGQLSYLKKNYEISKLSNALKLLSRGEQFKKPTVCLTFDDGFRCFYESAYPMLKKFNIPVTIFLTTKYIGSNDTIWTDKITGLFKFTTLSEIEVFEKKYSLNNLDRRKTIARDIVSRLKKIRYKDSKEVCRYLWKEMKNDYILDYPFLSWNKILEMDKELIEYGAHTTSHPILSKLPKEEQLYEIGSSKREIEKKIGKKIDMFAYPNGLKLDYNQETLEILKKNEFKYAFLNAGGPYTKFKYPDFEIPRIPELLNENNFFALRVAGLS